MQAWRLAGRIGMVLGLCVGLGLGASAVAQQTYTLRAPVAAKVEHRGQSNVDLGDFYQVGGQRIDLLRRSDQLVVQLRASASADVVEDLVAPSGPLAGYAAVRDFGNGMRMFANPALAASRMESATAYTSLRSTLSRLDADARVQFAVPVFVNAELGTYAVATDELLVRLKPGVRPETFFADERFARFEQAPASDAYLVRVAAGAGEPVLALAAALQGDPRILWAEPNFYQERQRFFTPNDPLFPDQWHLNNTGQGGGTPGADAKLVPAWDVATTAGEGVVIAIVDDGPELSHPDLAVYTNPNEIAGNAIDDDGNGFIDDVRGWDFTSAGAGDNDGGPSLTTDEHGTSVAGVAAARGNNAAGVTGAAFRATIFPARIFLGPTATSDANIGAALAYASGRARLPGATNWRGADIVNNSWGGGGPSTAINDALTWAATNGRGGRGTAHFFATGNSGPNPISLPASLSGTIASVIAVGASNNIDVRSSYSQFGPQLDFVAPSNDQTNGGTLAIWTTDRLGAPGYNGLANLDYTNAFGGTSSATPLAAGVGALLLGLDPTLTVAQLRALMRSTADRIGPLAYDANGFNVQYGYGRINANRAVRALNRASVGVNLGNASVASGTAVTRTILAGQAQTLTFTVRSVGQLDLNLSGLQVTGPASFTLSQPLGATTLPLGQSTTFEVSFTSLTAGTFNATASFTTNDADLPTFTIPIQFTVSPVSIGGKVFEDRNGDGVIQPGESPRAGETVYLDLDNSGTPNPPTESTVNSAANLGLIFTDTTPTSSARTVLGLGPELQGLEVRVTLTHTWVSDVRLVLEAPNGSSIELVSGAGGSGDNMTNTVFADDATVAIAAGTAPFTGRFRPNQPLGTFLNSNPNGTWTLRAFDLAAGDNGTLVNWSLTLRHAGEPRRTSNAVGDYAFIGLAPGNYRVRSAPGSGWSQVSPAGAHLVTVVGSESNLGRHFGHARQNSVYGTVYNDVDGNGGFNPGTDTARAGATVFLDINGNETLEPPVPVALPRSPALPIPDNATVTDTLVSVTTGQIVSLTVALNITHTWVGDLEVRLTSPAGTVIPLVLRRGGSGDNFTGTIFDDAAAVAISAGTAPFTGSFRPEQPLVALIGQAAAGNWQLAVTDRGGGDTGTLVNWSLNLVVASEPSQASDSLGNFRFDGVSGSNSLRMIQPAGLRLSEPVTGSYPLSLAAGQFVQNRNFGLAPAGVTVTPTSGLTTTEVGGTAAFTVVLNAQPTADVSIGLSSSDTTEGTVSPSSLTFTGANWNVAQVVTVTGVDDSIDDGNVAYTIVTAPASSGDPAYSGFNAADVSVTNTDDDNAGVTVTQSGGNTAVTEGGATDDYTLVLTSQPTANVTVAVNPTAQLTTSVASVTFTSANWNLPQTVTVTAVDDNVAEGNHSGSISHTVSSADGNYSGLTVAGVTATITDNDNPGVTVAQSNGNTAVTEGGATDDYTLVLTSQPTANVTVAVNPNAQLTTSVASVTFTSGNWNLPQTVTVTAVDDNVAEGNHSGTVSHTVSSADAAYNGVTVASVTASITDNDLPTLSINDVSVTEGNTGTATLSFTVTRTGATTSAAGFGFATANGTATAGSDYVAASGTGSIPAGGASGTTTVSVTINGDAVFENNETLFVNLSAPTNATIGDGQGIGTITNDDTAPTLSINDVSIVEGNTGTSSLVFTVTRTGLTELPATFTATTADGTATAPSDYLAALTGSTSIAAGGATGTTTLTATINGDAVVEPNETFFVNLTAPGNATISDSQGIGTITNDDVAGIIVTQSNGNTAVTEGGATDDYTLVLTSQPTADVTVAVNPNAQLTTSVASVTFTSANWNLPQTVTVTAVDDNVAEGNHSGTVSHTVTSADAAYNGVTVASVAVDITDNDLPTLSIDDVSVTEGNTGTATLSFTVTRTGATTSAAGFAFATANGTATAGSDYVAVSGTGSIPAGGASGTTTVSVTINGDAVFESNETLFVNLTAPSNATIGDGQGIGTITNDDTAPTLSINDVSIVEGNTGTSSLVFTVTRTGLTELPATFTATTADGTASAPSDYLAALTGSTSIAAGGATGTTTLTATINGDAVVEPNETFFVNLTAPGNATVADSQGIGTITNDDVAGIIVTPSNGSTTVTEGGATDDYTLVLTSQPTANVVIALTSGTQLTATPSPVTFTPTNWNTPQTVTVTAVDDNVAEGNHSGTVSHTVTSADAAYNGLSVADVTASITDNDLPTLSINDVSVTEGNTGTATLSFTVTRSGATTSAAGFGFATANGTATAGSDYVAVSGTGSIPAGGASGTTTVSVTINGDAVFESNETLFVNLTAPTNATIGDGQGIGTITNDDTAPTLSINDVSIVEGNTGTSSLVFTVTRTGLTELPATFMAATADGTATAPSDYLAALTGSTSIAAGGATGTTTLTATINGDAVVEPNETFFVNLTAPGNATISDNQGSGTITNDDVAGITVTQSNGNTAVTEGGATDSYTLVLTSQPTADVVIALTSGTQLTATPSPLTFTPTNWNTPQSVTVTAVDDAIAEGTHNGSVTHAVTSGDANYQGRLVDSVSVTITDNDVAGVTVTQLGGNTAVTEGGATDTVDVVLSSQPLANVTVTITPNAQLTVAPSPLTFTSANWNVAQSVTVTAANDVVVEGTHNGTLGFAVASTDPAYAAITLPGITASITDNDSAVVSFAPASVSQSEASSPMAFTVTLSNPVASGVTVKVDSADGTATTGPDYSAIIGGSVTFAPNSTTAQTVNVTVTNDALDEDNETFSLTLSGINATGDVTLGTATATGTIEDDDALPTLSVANVTQPEGNASNTLTFTVNLSPVSGRAVSFTRATVDGSAVSTGPNADFVAIPASTVTIPAGQTSVTIPVTINGDTVFEGDQSFTLAISDVANATPGSLSATATLTDDDQQPTTTTIVSDLPDPSVVGQPYPVTVEVRAQTLSPLGTVSITDGSGASCDAPLVAGTPPLSTMTCTLTSTSAGARTLTASYTPANDAFAASNATESHTVNAAATSLVLLGPARARIGTAASYTAELSVTAPGVGTPAGVVTVSSGPNSCTITLPTATPSCTITYGTLGSRSVSATFAPGNGNFLGSTATPVQTLVFASSDVSVTKTNAVGTYRPGDLLVYTVIVRNNGPDAAPQVRIRDVAPAGLTNVAWTCEASGGAICPDSGGTGTLDHIVATLPSNGVLTYAYFGNVTGRPAQIVNTAEVILPADTTIEDPNLANNSATDTDLLDDLFADGFEAPGINAESGGVRLAGASLRSSFDDVARVRVRLSDARGEALRVYVRVVGGELQVALAVRSADGTLRLGAWQRPVGDAELTWTATPTAGGYLLSGATLR